MPFPRTNINPLVAVIIYDLKGNNIFELENAKNEVEKTEIHSYFIHPIEFYQWVRRYNEITIFRGKFRATYITFIDLTLLFVSRVENIAAEIRPIILNYITGLGQNVVRNLTTHEKEDLLIKTCGYSYDQDINQFRNQIDKIYSRLGIERMEPEPLTLDIPKEEEPVISRTETQAEVFEQSRPFESVPKIRVSEMTQEILDEANKRAITSLLFSSIRGCVSPSASAYIYTKNDGAIGELYAGNLEERKIVYVLETITQFPRVIFEMINSDDEIKALNAEVVQIIVEESSDGKILVGMTTNVNDVINVGYKFKIIKHILNTMGF
ncbi:MAG: hypothetical protein GOP50_13615 [Candidatus Heimdallarchaeota archaeon]|nr:hypothetical protein [Candidatus Heimdallarchaeota archaeon]